MRRLLLVAMVVALLITVGGIINSQKAQAQYTSWAQITVQNSYDTSIRFFLDNNVMDDIGPGFFRTYQVKPGYHFLEAVAADGKKISRSVTVEAGQSPTWTIKVIWQ